MKGDLAKNGGWSLELQQRLRENALTFDQIQMQSAVDYNPWPFLKIELGYRFFAVYDPELNFNFRQRIHTDLQLRQDILRFRLKYRTRLQYGFDDFRSAEGFANNALIQRHLYGLEYDIFRSRFKPYMAFEFYHHLNKKGGSRVIRIRYNIGTEVMLSYHSTMDIRYIIKREINRPDPAEEYILCISYRYRF